MVLKRKRSESEISFSSSSAFGSPPRPEQNGIFDFGSSSVAMPSLRLRPTASSHWGANTAPSHLPSRTMKRVRDNRPSEDEVYERTLHMLYTAQKQQGGMPPPAMAEPELQPTATSFQAPKSAGAAQASLHSFWRLPSTTNAPPASSSASADIGTFGLPTPTDSPTSCEDCGNPLGGGNEPDGDAMMDVDEYVSGVSANCGRCGKHVCSHCSITNMGEEKRCLGCAGSKVWVGGSGWSGMDVGGC